MLKALSFVQQKQSFKALQMEQFKYQIPLIKLGFSKTSWSLVQFCHHSSKRCFFQHPVKSGQTLNACSHPAPKLESCKFAFNFPPYKRRTSQPPTISTESRISGDKLPATGQPLQEEETVSYLHADLYAHLLSYELRMEHHTTSLQINTTGHTTNITTCSNRGGSFGQRGRGRGCGRTNYERGVTYQGGNPNQTYPLNGGRFNARTDLCVRYLEKLDAQQFNAIIVLTILINPKKIIFATTPSYPIDQTLVLPITLLVILKGLQLKRNTMVQIEFRLAIVQVTKRTILQGKCERGLYPINASSITFNKTVLITNKISQDQWHRIEDLVIPPA